MNVPLQNVLDRLERVKDHGAYFMALCPAHADRNPSLEVRLGDTGNVLLHCHAGCTFEEVVDALRLKPADLFPDSGNGNGAKPKLSPIIAEYFYHDAGGVVLFRVTRHEPMPDGPKPFRQWRPNGKGGWIQGIKGYVEPVPYQLPQVLEAVKCGGTVYIAEGEKDVHSLEALGLTATCNPGGAGKWKASYSEHLQGAEIVILPDNDPPGTEHGQDVAAKTRGLAASVKVVELPGLPPKGDVSDWLQAGHTREELLDLVEAAGQWKPGEAEELLSGPKPKLFMLSDLLAGELEPVAWTVENLIPSGGISVLGGDSNVGKSWVGCSLGLTVAAGIPFLGHFRTQACPVLFFDAEMGERLIRRRVKRLFTGLAVDGQSLPCDLPFRVFEGPLRIDTPKQIAGLVTLLNREGIRLVIADPLIHSLPEGTNENDSASMARFFEAVRFVQSETGAAFVFTHHSRKRSMMNPNEAGQMLRGSSAIRGVLDSHLFLRKLPSGGLLAEHDKSRHAEAVPNFIVTVTDPDAESTVVRYGGETEESSDQTAIAAALITRVLTDAGGTLKRREILEHAKSEGLKERTVIRALGEAVEAKTLTTTKEGKESVYTLRAQEELWQE